MDDEKENQNKNYKVEILHHERSTLAEGPFWDADRGLLFWVDMKKVALNTYDPVTDKHAQASILTEKLEGPVTLVIRVKGTKDVFLVGMKGALALVRWDGKSPEKLKPKHVIDVEDPNTKSRTNDGKADPANRLWVGTMGAQLSSNPNTFEKDKGSMFRVTPDGKKKRFLKNMQISNGLEWSLDAKKFYLVDSFTYQVYQFDYDNENGEIKNQEVIYDCKKEGQVTNMNSLPDGMTIDEEGYLWVALYAMGKVIRIDPKTKTKVHEIIIPNVLQPTSVAWGGKNLDILFVTTAHVDWTPELEKEFPDSGKLVKISNLGVKGIPSRDVVVDKKFLEDV